MKMSNLVKLYEGERCNGIIETLTAECADLRKLGLTSGASSIVVPETSGNWDVSTKPLFGLPKNTLLTGRRYHSLTEMGLQSPIMSLRPTPKITSESVMLFEEEQCGGNTVKMSNLVKLYEKEHFAGYVETLAAECADLRKKGLTTGASSIDVPETSGNWDVFTKPLFGLPKNTLLTGRGYHSLTEMGLQSPIMSLRPSPKITSESVMLFEEEQCGGNTVTLTAECADLRKQGLTTGASSIIVSETSCKWDAFIEPGLGIPIITLLPGRVYQCPADMGLQRPIMSLCPSL